jgi:hypothetical protein
MGFSERWQLVWRMYSITVADLQGCRFARSPRKESLLQGRAYLANLRTSCTCSGSLKRKQSLTGLVTQGRLYCSRKTCATPQGLKCRRGEYLADLLQYFNFVGGIEL